jgi:hypothetical protein
MPWDWEEEKEEQKIQLNVFKREAEKKEKFCSLPKNEVNKRSMK